MLPRLLPLLGLSLMLAGLAHAAPAPLRKDRPDQPAVELRGWLRQRPVGEPCAITRQADWQAVAKAWGIAEPPRVDFRTHFLFVHVTTGYGEVRCEIDGRGDLRAVRGGGGWHDGIVEECGKRPGPCYLLESFRRSAVKTVNGLPVPKN